MLGILLIDKPLGVTSHDVVNQIRCRFGTKRVGHAGTLDPLGTGLLVVAVGPATRFLQYLALEPKEYEAEITFGQESNTQDAEGELTDPKHVPADIETQLHEAIPRFLGMVQQIPPMFSAVKIKGKALYHYARKGEEIEREPRNVYIDSIAVTKMNLPKASVTVVCSGGTYMRTLVHDIGQRIGCGAYLSGLRRTRCGEFHLNTAVPPDRATIENLLPMETALHPMPILDLNPTQSAAIRQGQRISLPGPVNTGLLGLKDSAGNLLGVARALGNQLQPECVLPIEVQHGSP